MAEARVLALRRALDDSLKVYQDEQTAVRRSNCSLVRRPLTIIYRSKNAALLDISSADPATSPLHVTIDESTMVSDSLSSSPADSVDSGVSASSESSEKAHGPTAAAAARVRQRSMSECYTYGHAPPLKGILKRRPMCRSVSESHQEEDEEAVGRDDDDEGSEEDRQRSADEVDAVLDALAASQTSLDVDGNERPKKRVSFSERVQERCFRPNSSILGQRKKNQKKHRKRQSSTDSTTTVSSDGDGDDDSAIFRSLATQPPLPPAVKPRFFVGVVDLDDDDHFQPGEVAQLLVTSSSDSSASTPAPPASLDNTIQDMDETIQDDGSSFDSNNNDSVGGEIDERAYTTSKQPQNQPMTTKEARKDSGLDLEVVDEMAEIEGDAVNQPQPDSGKVHWVSKQRILARKIGKPSSHQERKSSGDSGMSDDEVFTVTVEE